MKTYTKKYGTISKSKFNELTPMGNMHNISKSVFMFPIFSTWDELWNQGWTLQKDVRNYNIRNESHNNTRTRYHFYILDKKFVVFYDTYIYRISLNKIAANND